MLRDAAVLDDSQDAMPISVWEQHIDHIDKKKSLNITLNLLISKLSPTNKTIISFSNILAK